MSKPPSEYSKKKDKEFRRKWGQEIVTGKTVYTAEALDASPYVQWLRSGGKGPPPTDAGPVIQTPDAKPSPPPPPKPDPAPEGQCALCCVVKPLVSFVGRKAVCHGCAMDGVDRELLDEVLEELRRPPKPPPVVSRSHFTARPRRRGNSSWTAGEELAS